MSCMNWFVNLILYNILILIFQSFCFPKKEEIIIKQKDILLDEENNTKLNSDNNISKSANKFI